MGNALSASAPPPPYDLRQLVHLDHPALLFETVIGRGKFLKSVRAKFVPRDAGAGRLAPGEGSIAVEGRVVVKAFVQRGDRAAPEAVRRLAHARAQLGALCRLFNLRDQPSLLPYARWEESSRSDAAYLLRAHVAHNMYDRLNSRPFPGVTEKLWFIYQLLRAVAQAHGAGVRHGDIKVENVLVTSWGWVFLTDFATFKPTFLAEDSPVDFGFFFESPARPLRCYLAPERLVRARDLPGLQLAAQAAQGGVGTVLQASQLGSAPRPSSAAITAAASAIAEGAPLGFDVGVSDSALRESMDIFALGCTIGEIVLDGEAFFEQATLLKYRSGGVSSAPPSSVATASASTAADAGSGSAVAASDSSVEESIGGGSGGSGGGCGDFDPMAVEGVAEGFAYMNPSGALKALVAHMTARNPLRRSSAAEYLSSSTTQVSSSGPHLPGAAPSGGGGGGCPSPPLLFPSYFPALFGFFARLHAPELASADARVLAVACAYSDLVFSITEGCVDPFGDALFSHRLGIEATRGEAFRATLSALSTACGAAGRPRGGHGGMATHARATYRHVSHSLRRRRGEPLSSAFCPSQSVSSTSIGSAAAPPRFSVAGQRAAAVSREVSWEWGWCSACAAADATASSCGAGGEDSSPSAPPCSSPWCISGSSWTSDFCDVADPVTRRAFIAAFSGGLVDDPTVPQSAASLCMPHAKWQPYAWAWRPAPTAGSNGMFPSTDAAAASGGGATVISNATSSAVCTGPTSVGVGGTLPPAHRSSIASSVGAHSVRTERSAWEGALTNATADSGGMGGGREGGVTSGTAEWGSGGAPPPHTLQARIDACLNAVDTMLAELGGGACATAATTSIGAAAELPSVSAPAPPPLPSSDQGIAASFVLQLIPTDSSAVDGRGFAMLLTLLTSCLRHVSSVSTLITALLLISRLSAWTCDDTRLERVVPYLTSLLSHASPMVRAHALACLTTVLDRVEVLPAADVGLFLQYLLPLLQRTLADTEPVVQMAAGECFPRLLTSAKRCLDASTATRVQLAALLKARAANGSSSEGVVSTTVAAAAAVPAPSFLDVAAAAASDLVRIRCMYDVDLANLRRRMDSQLRKWLLSAQGATAATQQLVLMDGAFTRAAVLGPQQSRNREDALALRNRNLLIASEAGGGAHARDPALSALLGVGGGVSWDEEADLIDGDTLSRLGDALRMLPSHLDATLMRTALLGRKGALELSSFFGRAGSEGSLVALLFTFLQDTTIATALTTVADTLTGVLLRLPPSGSNSSGAVEDASSIATPQLKSQLLSWLNRSLLGVGDWKLRCSFFEALADLAPSLGPYNTRLSLLPFFEQALATPCDPIIHTALKCLSRIIAAELLPRSSLTDLLMRIAPLLLHPSQWVRSGAATFIAAEWCVLGWPAAFTMTSRVLNALLVARTGKDVWIGVGRLLRKEQHEPTAVYAAAGGTLNKALVNVLEVGLIEHLPRAAFDSRAHRITVEALKSASPSLATRLEAAAAAASAGAGSGTSFSDASEVEEEEGDSSLPGAAISGGSTEAERTRRSSSLVPPQAEDMTPLAFLQRAAAAASAAALAKQDVDSAASLNAWASPSIPHATALVAAAAPFAPSFPSPDAHVEYTLRALDSHIIAVAGPHRFSAATCTRMTQARHARLFAEECARVTGLTPVEHARVIQPVPGRNHLEMGVLNDLQPDGAVPPPPYTDAELARLPLRSISFPDQRYASLHPPMTPSLEPPRCGPEDDYGNGASASDSSSSLSLLIGGTPPQTANALAHSGLDPRAVEGTMLTGVVSSAPHHKDTLEEDRGVLATVTLPALCGTLAGNAPLPEDLHAYAHAIAHHVRARRAATTTSQGAAHPTATFAPAVRIPLGAPLDIGVGSPEAQSLRGRRGPPSLLHGSSSVSVGPPQQRTLHDETPSMASIAAAAVDAPIHHHHHHAPRAHSHGAALSSTSRRLVDYPISSHHASPLASGGHVNHSPLAHTHRLRAHYRAAGRRARALYLRHGLWDGGLGHAQVIATGIASGAAPVTPLPNTASISSPGATAFFYKEGGGSSNAPSGRFFDPSLLDSDDDGARAVVRITRTATASSGFDGEDWARAASPTPTLFDGGVDAADASDDAPFSIPSYVDSGTLTGALSSSAAAAPGGSTSDTRATPMTTVRSFSTAAIAAVSSITGASEAAAFACMRGSNAVAAAITSAVSLGAQGGGGLQGARRKGKSEVQNEYNAAFASSSSGGGGGGDAQAVARAAASRSTPSGGAPGSSAVGVASALQNPWASAGPSPRGLDASFIAEALAAEALVGKSGATRSRPARSVPINGSTESSVLVSASMASPSSVTAAVASSGAMLVTDATAPSSSSTAVGIVINSSYVSTYPQAAAPPTPPPPSSSSSSSSIDASSTAAALKRRSTLQPPPVGGGGRAQQQQQQSGQSLLATLSHSRRSSGVSGSGGTGGDDRDYLDSAKVEALARRIAALDIPPLPLPLGHLCRWNSTSGGGGDAGAPAAAVVAAPLSAHALRVANGVSRLDALSSACSGLGGGQGVAPASIVGNARAVLDEAPRLWASPDVATAASAITFCAEPALVAGGPQALASAVIVPVTPTAGLAPLSPAGRSVISSGNINFNNNSSSGSSAGSSALALPLAGMPLPPPSREDIIRPGDVGDGSGYIGAGRASFAALERGWTDGLGIGPAPGSVNPVLTAALSYTPILPAGGNGSNGSGTGGNNSGSGTGGSEGGVGTSWDSSSGDATSGSRPRGILFTSCNEHTGGITALAVCGDHSFFASASLDGTVRVWPTRGLDRDVMPSSAIVYSGHAHETAAGARLGGSNSHRGVGGGAAAAASGATINHVTDAIVLDSTASIASASTAGTVHVWRVDVAGAAAAAARAAAGGGARNVPSSVGGRSQYDGLSSMQPRGTYGGFVRSSLTANDAGGIGEELTPRVHATSSPVSSSSSGSRTPEGVTIVRRFTFDAPEGGVVSVRHYDADVQSVLTAATSGGVLHGLDLRARREAWMLRVPPEFGPLTAMEVCPGSSSVLIGTVRGVIALLDTRAGPGGALIVAAWRHSSRAPVHALYPYVTLLPRSDAPTTRASSNNSTWIMPHARQLAVGVCIGQGETSFWNLETGVCLRLLRSLPQRVNPADAWRAPHLSRIALLGGRVVAPAAAASLRSGPLAPPSSSSTAAASPSPNHAQRHHALAAASRELLHCTPYPGHVRTLLCPLPSGGGGLTGGATLGTDSSISGGERLGVGPDGGGGGGAGGGGGGSGGGASGDGGGGPSFSRTAGAGGVGFTLSGLRGAGAQRRRGEGFVIGFTPSASDARDPSSLLPRTSSNGAPGGVVASWYGSHVGEGLPVWLLTGGSDGRVRCWDLDRPRASHTVCGLSPCEPREGYEGTTLVPTGAGGSGYGEGGGADTEEEEEEKEDVARGDFVSWHSPDGMASHAGVRGGQQRGLPLRVISSFGVTTPLEESDASSGGLPSNPFREGKGPVPAPTHHASLITSLAWLDLNPRLLLSGSADGTVKLWS